MGACAGGSSWPEVAHSPLPAAEHTEVNVNESFTLPSLTLSGLTLLTSVSVETWKKRHCCTNMRKTAGILAAVWWNVAGRSAGLPADRSGMKGDVKERRTAVLMWCDTSCLSVTLRSLVVASGVQLNDVYHGGQTQKRTLMLPSPHKHGTVYPPEAASWKPSSQQTLFTSIGTIVADCIQTAHIVLKAFCKFLSVPPCASSQPGLTLSSSHLSHFPL